MGSERAGRALVTGASGFAGPHLVRELERHGWEVWTVSRSDPEGERRLRADLRDAEAVRAALDRASPDAIFHLAAQSSVPASFRDPVGTLANNLLGAANLLYAAAELLPRPRVVVAGSAEEYGRIRPEELPIDEEQPVRPVSPYGVSKAAQSLLALSLAASRQLPVVVIRAFNHTGPGQRADFAVPAFARQLARIEAGIEAPVLRVGDLTARRDLLDVRDVARAYRLAAIRAPAGAVYNLGSGRSVTMHWVLDSLLALSEVRARIEIDPARLSPASIPELRADAGLFAHATGWRSEIPLERTLADVLDDWRERTRGEGSDGS